MFINNTNYSFGRSEYTDEKVRVEYVFEDRCGNTEGERMAN